MKKLVLMIMLFLGAQCDAHPWDGSLTSPRIWENPNEEVGEFIQQEDKMSLMNLAGFITLLGLLTLKIYFFKPRENLYCLLVMTI
ncbi:MAG: hypothetical protein LBD98_01700 [Endomicrobium sp.]|jgi:dolichol kinase|nr:hypothetical protein [Endomicrobium sp.]